jgi:hypothetical protein
MYVFRMALAIGHGQNYDFYDLLRMFWCNCDYYYPVD